MINRALLRKCISEAKWLLLGCSAVILAFCWLRVWLVSRLDTERFQRILDNLPDTWKRFAPVDFEWLVTYAGRISTTFNEPIVVFGVAIWAIARGSDCVSGELGRGTMEMLLAQPVSRAQILFTQAAVTLTGVLVLSLAAWGGIVAGLHTNTARQEIQPTFHVPLLGTEVPLPFGKPEVRITPMSQLVAAELFLPAVVNLFSLGVFLAGLSTLASSWDRYRWRTIGLVVGVFVVELIVKLVGQGVDYLSWLLYASMFTVYEPQRLVQIADQTPESTWSLLLFDAEGAFAALGPSGYSLVLLVLGIIFYAGAATIFSRRDLPAPL
jgi:ABC-2 type transport system permease protein